MSKWTLSDAIDLKNQFDESQASPLDQLLSELWFEHVSYLEGEGYSIDRLVEVWLSYVRATEQTDSSDAD